jgi:hypothetical protein
MQDIPVPNNFRQDAYSSEVNVVKKGILSPPEPVIPLEVTLKKTEPGNPVMPVQVTISISVDQQMIAWRLIPGDKIGDVLNRLIAGLGFRLEDEP